MPSATARPRAVAEGTVVYTAASPVPTGAARLQSFDPGVTSAAAGGFSRRPVSDCRGYKQQASVAADELIKYVV